MRVALESFRNGVIPKQEYFTLVMNGESHTRVTMFGVA